MSDGSLLNVLDKCNERSQTAAANSSYKNWNVKLIIQGV